MAEYTELQLKAKEEGIKSWHVKSDEVLAAELAEKWAQTPEDENDEEVIEETIRTAPAKTPAKEQETPAKEPENPAKDPEGKVTFYWKDKRNCEFSIETVPASPTTKRQAEYFASTNSVMVLDPAIPIQKKAIEKLRKSPDYNIAFAEVDSRRATPDKKGAKLDELMELDHKVLVQMVGGSVQDARKTKGELIMQIMNG